MRVGPAILLGALVVAVSAADEPDVPAGSAEVDGVIVEARAGAWDLAPAGLASEVTPLWVRIENRSSASLEVRWAGFVLESQDGAHVALPPPDDDERLFDGRAFLELPPDERFEVVYGRDLPAGDLGAAALREGVLAPGGEASGYLYFDPAPGRLTLYVQLADARTGGPGVDLAVEIAERELARADGEDRAGDLAQDAVGRAAEEHVP